MLLKRIVLSKSLVLLRNAVFLSLCVGAPAFAAGDDAIDTADVVDPWEGFNRSVFEFNRVLDDNILLPVTKGYKYITPDPVETGVSNFFDNLDDVRVLVNSFLQLKIKDGLLTTSRFLANTVMGIGGIFDVATPLGIEKKNEDFGQTLGYWGVDSGPYVVIPFWGPSNVRDGLGLIPDFYLGPVTYVEDDTVRYTLYGLRILDMRSRLMKAEELISGDRYTFIRDAYMQRREFLVNDGAVDINFDDDNF